MIVGSICSGIGAETLASEPLGWTVDFYSEIEKFPSAVLNHHFPYTPNEGDFTKIKAANHPNVEIIVGGPPCQSFSIAGNRGGLNDNRGNLTLNYVDMCHDFATNGSLRWAFYENVPGILSDKTNAFGCLISGLVGADDPFTPPDGESWPKCGMASGPRSRLAWRVLDAQHFGLAQRRKRVFIVVGFADGCDPAQVLFERKGVRGDIETGRSEGQEAAGNARKGVTVGSHWDGTETHPALSQSMKSSGGIGASNQEVFSQRGAGLVPHPIPISKTVGSLTDGAHNGGGLNGQDAYSGRIFPVAFNSRQDPVSGDIAGALDTCSPQAQAVAIQDGRGLDKGQNGLGVSDTGRAYTVDTMGAQAVAHAYDLRGREGGAQFEGPHDTANIRAASGGSSRSYVAQHKPISWSEDLTPGIDIAATIVRGPDGGRRAGVYENYAVRRLTPIECARLQGFPDNHTLIPWRGKPAEQCPDGPQYKAYGNTWAVNCVAWIFARIDAVDKEARNNHG